MVWLRLHYLRMLRPVAEKPLLAQVLYEGFLLVNGFLYLTVE